MLGRRHKLITFEGVVGEGGDLVGQMLVVQHVVRAVTSLRERQANQRYEVPRLLHSLVPE